MRHLLVAFNNFLIGVAKELDVVYTYTYLYLYLYNLLEYSKNYRKTTGGLWNYYRDEPNSGAVGNTNYSIKD